MMERRGPNALTREVLSPQRPSTGLGVAIIASLAMLFAVAGSAFIVRARMIKQRCPAYPTAPAATQWTLTPHVESPCGTAAYHPNPDGSVMVFFRACPEDVAPAGDRAATVDANRRRVPSIEVGTIDW